MEASETNIEELKGEALDAALEARGLPKTGTADEKRQALKDRLAQDAKQGTTRVGVRWPVDSLDTGLEGVPVIGQEPTEVPKDKLDAIREAARTADVALIEARS